MAKSQLSINPRGVWSEMKVLEVWFNGWSSCKAHRALDSIRSTTETEHCSSPYNLHAGGDNVSVYKVA